MNTETQLKKNSTTSLYKRIRSTVRSQIFSDQLSDDFKLPSERQLVEKLGIHRNTVKKAYETLIHEGLVYASVKAPRGYFVRNSPSGVKPDGKPDTRKAFSSLDKNFNYHFLGAQSTFQRLYNSSYLSDSISFIGVLVNKETLPLSYLHEIIDEIISGDNLEPFWLCNPQGTEHMRACLASLLFGRKIYVQPQNIQIITETYKALSNIAFMYLKEGDFAIMEKPVMPAVVNILLHTGAHVLFVPVEEDGTQIEILGNLVERYRPKLIYSMPNFHSPSAAVMSLEKREWLLQCTLSHNVPIAEDDSLFDFNYSDITLPSLYSMDRTNSVIYIDSFNLSLFPGARVGYITAPDNVIKTYRRIMNKDQMLLNSLSQYMWVRFFEKGYYEKHRQFLIDFYRKKRDLMCNALSCIPGLFFSVPNSGLVIWIRLPEYTNDRQIAAAAERTGLLLIPRNTFFAEGSHGESYIRVPCSSVTDEKIAEECRRIAEVLNPCRV